MTGIDDWLEGLGLGKYAQLFAEHEITYEVLPDLTESDIKSLKLPIGSQRRLIDAVQALATSGARRPLPQRAEPPSTAQAAPTWDAERRQVTVMFCDLVGFTSLTEQLDPELLHQLMQAYLAVCNKVVMRYGGHIDQYRGDAVMAYFGWPSAHEDDAERSVRAALEIAQAVKVLQADTPLAVHIGIATGSVVIGALSRAEVRLAVGEAINLAQRLEDKAGPGEVLIAPTTRRLVGGRFELIDLGAHPLKGLAQPVRVWRVDAVHQHSGRFEAAQADVGLTPLVGRDKELALLQEQWTKAREGKGQVVLLGGEAGIGKSRLLSVLKEQLTAQGAGTFTFQCSPYHTNSALYPSIDNFERALKFGSEEDAESRLDKLEALIVGHYGRPKEDVRFVAALLSIPCEQRYGAIRMAPRRFKDETLRTLVDLVVAAARKQPSLLLFEDAHWADPTTLEALDLMIERTPEIPLLLVLTRRPEFANRWGTRSHVSALNLSKLTRAQAAAMVSRVANDKALPGTLLQDIVDKTDGVPLFVEELTRAVLESKEIEEKEDRYEYLGDKSGLTIPVTLRDSLMARLDRDRSVREVAQMGSVVGREFSYELLEAIALKPAAELNQALGRLTSLGLAFRRGTPPDARYIFKHALVQDAAYDSLLKSKRSQLHAQIAHVLEKNFPDTIATEPELLAHHYTQAGDLLSAIPLWRKAGEMALGRTAPNEAIAHLGKGLELTNTLPATPERDAMELALRALLGTAYIALRGWAAQEAEAQFRPALRLAKSLRHTPSYLPVLFGLYSHDVVQGRVAQSLRWVREIEETAEALSDSELRITGHACAMVSYFYLGRLQEAHRHGDRIAELCDADKSKAIERLTNQDPLVQRGIYGGPCLWMLGYPDQALHLYEVTEQHARARAHPFSFCYLLSLGNRVYELRGEFDSLLSRAEEGMRLGDTHSLPLFSEVLGPTWRGIALIRAGRAPEGVPQLQAALEKWKAAGAHISTPHYKAVLAEGIAALGQVEQALELVNECTVQIERPGWEERVWVPELLRLKGWMLIQQGRTQEAEVELRASIDRAREQQAKSWELRSSAALSELLAKRGQRDAARELLAQIYGWFTDGFDTKDLKEAKALLDELS